MVGIDVRGWPRIMLLDSRVDLIPALYSSTAFLSFVLRLLEMAAEGCEIINHTFIQSGRLDPHPRHSILSRLHIAQEPVSGSCCSSHFWGRISKRKIKGDGERRLLFCECDRSFFVCF